MSEDCRKEEVKAALVGSSVVASIAVFFMLFIMIDFYRGDLESAKALLLLTFGLMFGVPLGAFWFWFFGRISHKGKREKGLTV